MLTNKELNAKLNKKRIIVLYILLSASNIAMSNNMNLDSDKLDNNPAKDLKFSNKQIPYPTKVPGNFKIKDEIFEDEFWGYKETDMSKLKGEHSVMEYIDKENAYSEEFLKSMKPQILDLFHEIKDRIKLSDTSVPIKKGNYNYFNETFADEEYVAYGRVDLSTNKKEVILDVNELARNHEHTKLSFVSVSEDHRLLAYGIDHSGSEEFTIKVKDLQSSKDLDVEIPKTLGSIVWYKNGFIYGKISGPWEVKDLYYYDLDTKTSKLIYTEPQEGYNVSMSKTNSKRFLKMTSGDHGESRIRLFDLQTLDLEKPILDQVFFELDPKDEKEYEIEHSGNYIYILDNLVSNNFGVRKLNIANKKIEDFIIPSENPIDSIDVTQNYLIINYREKGLDKSKVIDISEDLNIKTSIENLPAKEIKYDEVLYSASTDAVNFEEDIIYTSFSSLKTPARVYEYSFQNEILKMLKEQEIPSGHDPEKYETKRLYIDSVPISLIFNKEKFKQDGSNNLHLVGYGAYGISMEPGFRSSIFSLLDRGIVYAIAHIRGGGDVNHDWYLQGKLLNKANTFDDFIKVAEHLISEKYTSIGKISISSGSAGGLLIGNALNKKPELFSCAVAHVPFVDLIATMADDSLPLTIGEYKEWGNPNDPKYLEYFKTYDVYRNTDATKYPPIFITGGLNDPRVKYWEPVKWAAKIRSQQFANPRDGQFMIMKINKTAGHSGKSGRYASLWELAEEFSFIINFSK